MSKKKPKKSKTKASEKGKDGKTKLTSVLVVGDWVVDEHLVVGEHRSPYGSRRGELHTRVLNSDNSSVLSLSGAGQVATILHQATLKDKKKFHILGVGVWYKGDDYGLKSMLDPQNTIGRTLHQIKQPKFSVQRDIRADLCNLAEGRSKKRKKRHVSFPFSTNHIVRNYTRDGDILRLILRADWEQQKNTEQAEKLEAKLKQRLITFYAGVKTKKKQDDKPKIDHIFIKDLVKLTVSPKIIEQLHKDYPEAKWYISSKDWNPDWFKQLPKANVRLILIPQVAAKHAIRKKSVRSSSWLIHGGHVSGEAMKAIESLAREYPLAKIVVLPDGMGLIGRPSYEDLHGNDGLAKLKKSYSPKERLEKLEKQIPPIKRSERKCDTSASENKSTKNRPLPLNCYVQQETKLARNHEHTSMASVFFPVLATQLIDAGDSAGKASAKNQEDFQSMLKRSLTYTRSWMDAEVKRLTKMNWNPLHCGFKSSDVKSNQSGLGRRPSWNWTKFNWRDEEKCWEDAFKDVGTVCVAGERGESREAESACGDKAKKKSPKKYTGKSQKEFQLLRSMTDIENYVCCVTPRRQSLQTLIEETRKFTESNRKNRRHMSYLVIDSPGSGKSYMVNCLSQSLDMRFLEFNITQMLNRNDLLHCFDRIVTYQAQKPDSPLLVFIDEINAVLDRQHVYDAFLAPLQDGIYTRSGNSFNIEPCFWVFAGTEAPSDHKSEDAKSEKGSDFESRLTLKKLDMRPDETQPSDIESAQMEKVYVGVSSIRKVFPDVIFVSEKVLRAFRALRISTGPRDIDRFVRKFEAVQYGRITSANLPADWFSEYEIPDYEVKRWKNLAEKEDDGSLVRIRDAFSS